MPLGKEITVNVKLFSHARYHFGKEEITLVLTEGATIKDVIAAIRTEGGPAFGSVPFRLAKNRKFAAEHEPVSAADELACIPPVQGG